MDKCRSLSSRIESFVQRAEIEVASDLGQRDCIDKSVGMRALQCADQAVWRLAHIFPLREQSYQNDVSYKGEQCDLLVIGGRVIQRKGEYRGAICGP